MKDKLPISNIILKIVAEKKAFSEDDLLLKIDEYLQKCGLSESEKPYYGISRSLKNLASRGLIEPLQADRTVYIRITPTGRQRLISSMFDSKTNLAHSRQDGYFRFVILDIPESQKPLRDSIRYLLRKAGFYCLKNSVWVSPYPLEHVIMDIKKILGLKNEMTILVTNIIDEDTMQDLYKHFKIKS